MTQRTDDAEQQAIRDWYKKKLDEVVQAMLKTGAVSGIAIEASPVWQAPYQVLLAKVWSTAEKSKFIWTINGEAVTTDHVAGSVAATPQEAARHFALKWQLDAERLTNLPQAGAGVENSEAHMEGYAEELVKYAELLYDLASQDELWKPKLH